MLRHFLKLSDLTAEELRALMDRAHQLKRMQHEKQSYEPLKGKTLGMIFDKS